MLTPPLLARAVRPSLLSLRGGTATATATAPLINCVAGASGFFGNVRTPAALLTGAALGSLFVKLENTRSEEATKICNSIYSFLVALVVIFEITVVFISTATSVRLSAGGFDPMATDAVSFLIREFEFAYLSTRFQFFTGLVAFLAALGLRAWTAFPGTRGNAMCFLLMGGVFNMLCFFNSTVVNYKLGLLGMGWRLAQLSVAQMITCPFGVAALGCLAISIGLTGKALMSSNP